MANQVLHLIEVKNSKIEEFYKKPKNKSLDILHFDFNNEESLETLSWSRLKKDKAEIIIQLKKHQRLLRLYPDKEVALELMRCQFSSANEIAELHESQFVQQCPGINESIAMKIHQQATDIRERTALLSANLRDVIASPHYQASRFNDIEKSFIDFARDNTDLELMTINNTGSATDECLSIFSPSKYFLELSELIKKISEPREDKFKLYTRRPDLNPLNNKIPFDRHYSETEIPYLDLVNEIVHKRLELLLACQINENISPKQSLQKLSIEKLKYDVKDKSTWKLVCSDGSAIYDLIADGNQKEGSTKFKFKSAKIECAIGDYIIPNVYHHLASSSRFPFNLPFHLPLEYIRSFLNHFKIDLATVFEKLLAPSDIISQERLKLSHGEYLLITKPNLDESELKKSYGIGEIISLNDMLTFILQTDMTRSQVQELIYQNLTKEEQKHPSIFRRFFINRDIVDPHYLTITQTNSNPPVEIIKHLDNLPTLDRLHRFVRLSKKLKWSFTDLDWVLNTLNLSDASISDDNIIDISHIEYLRKRFNAPLDVICSLWSDMKTYGKGDNNQAGDIFNLTFNSPVVFDMSVPEPYLPKYEGNPMYTSTLLEWNPKELNGKDAQLRQRLCASLSISDRDLVHLIKFLYGEDTIPVKSELIILTVPLMSKFYRFSKLAELLKLSIEEFLLLLELIGINDIGEVADVLEITKWADWLKSSSLTAYELEYLRSETVNSYVDPGYAVDDVMKMLSSMPDPKEFWKLDYKNFISNGIPRGIAIQIFKKLIDNGFINKNGIVLKNVEDITYDSLSFLLKKTRSKIEGALPPLPVQVLDFTDDFDKRVYIDCGTSKVFDIKDSITVEAWVKRSGKSNGMILYKGGIFEGYPGYGLYWFEEKSNEYLHAGLSDSKGWTKVGNLNPVKNKWIHIAYTWDSISKIFQLYINGEKGESKIYKHNIGIANFPLIFGSVTVINGTHFIGHIVDVRIWNRSRTQHEIKDNMNTKLTGKESRLVGYWPMDEPVHQFTDRVQDLTDNNNHGIINAAGNHTVPKWKTVKDLPIDQRIIFIRDILRSHRNTWNSTVDGALADFFTVENEVLQAAIRFTNLVTKTNCHIELLLGSKASEDTTHLLPWMASLAHKLFTAKTFSLNGFSFNGIIDHSKAFGLPYPIPQNFKFSLIQLEILQQFEILTEAFLKTPPGIFGVIAEKDHDKQVNQLEHISGWSADEITIAKALGLVKPNIDSIQEISKLRDCFELCQLMGIDITTLHEISKLHDNGKTEWHEFEKGAASLFKAVNSKYESEQWQKIINPINEHLNEIKRDALAGYCAYLLDLKERLEDLYEYLLIDVEMSGCARISRIKQGINSLQLYVHRCKAGLEEQVINEITEKEWKMNGQYRVWEANKKLATYPENYFDPGLRKLKTPIYEEVQQEIMQGDLTEEAAEQAYRNYFEKFSELANLQPIDALYTTVKDHETGLLNKTLFFIARARIAPHTYYLRKAKVGIEALSNSIFIKEWTPWEHLQLSSGIQSKTITPVFAFEKLFLFWVEISEITKTRMEGGKSIATSGTFAHVQYIYQDVKGQWSAPQTLMKDILFSVIPEKKDDSNDVIKKSFIGYEPWMKDVDRTDGYWKKVYPLYLPNQLDRGKILILFGNHGDEFGPRGLVYKYKCVIPILLNEDLTIERKGVTLIGRENDDPVHNIRLSQNDFGIFPTLKLSAYEPLNEIKDNWLGPLIKLNSIPEESLDQISTLANCIPVKNVLGWSIFDNGDEAFLTFPEKQVPEELSQSVTGIDAGSYMDIYCNKHSYEPKFTFVRLTTQTVQVLTSKFFTGGLNNLLNLDSQQLPELEFKRFEPSTKNVNKPHSDSLDFSGPFGEYFWEIFFTIPFLLAKSLNEKKRFEESQKWYNFLFDPNNPKVDPVSWGIEQFGAGNPSYFCPFEGNVTDKMRGIKGETNEVSFPYVTDFPGCQRRQVINFSGSGNSYLIIPAKDLLNHLEITLEFWLKIEEDTPHDELQRILHQAPDGERIMSIYLENNELGFHVNGQNAKSGFKLLKKRWYHCAFSYKLGDHRRIYIDGIHYGIPYGGDAPNPKYDKTTIWKTKTNAKMADLVVWWRNLTPIEIRSRSNHTRSGNWRFFPIRNINKTKVISAITNPVYLSAYERFKSDAESKARLEPIAFQKAITMRYIDNLLDWGDGEFTKDSWENNVLATMLYVQAGDILGRQPKYLSQSGTTQLTAAKSNGLASEKLIQLEQFIKPVSESCLLSAGHLQISNDGFCTPENEELVNYWNLVADRLFKLRHCMNIEGVIRMLAQYQSPIDPRQIIERLAGSESLAALPENSSTTTLKFPEYIKRAIRATRQVQRLGKSLLQALESFDAADVDMLVLAHEEQLMSLTTNVKEQEISEQEAIIQSLELGRARILAEGAYNTAMFAGLDGTPLDLASLVFSGAKIVISAMTIPLYTAAAAADIPPKIFGVAVGGFDPGGSVEKVASMGGVLSEIADTAASMLAYTADIWRRKAEQTAQIGFNAIETAQIDQDLTSAKIRLEILEKEKKIHERSLEQWQEKNTLIQGQFTGPDLYRWMIQRLSTIYLQAYNVASDLALAAEKAYLKEREATQKYIKRTHWDGVKKGLLAAEGLMVDLELLDKAFIDNEPIEQMAFTKEISLKKLSPQAFAELLENGCCTFDFTERLFDLDFPGHYLRKIKTVSLSVKGQFDNVNSIHATLKQLNNYVLKQADINAAKFLLKDIESTQQKYASIRFDNIANQQIAVCHNEKDCGLFELKFDGNHYLPFEGTGAISKWELRMPKAANRFDFKTITDVIIHLQYTAEDGGTEYTNELIKTEALSEYSDIQAISLREKFGNQWNQFLNSDSEKHNMNFALEESLFKINMKANTLKIGSSSNGKNSIILMPVFSQEASKFMTKNFKLEINNKRWNSKNGKVKAPEQEVLDSSKSNWPVELVVSNIPEQLLRKNTDAYLSVIDQEALLDIIMIIPFEGKLDWRGLA